MEQERILQVLPGDEASTPICQTSALLGQMCQAQTVIDAPIIVITAYGDPTRGKAIDGGTTALN
jgi:hypothetical protein